MAITTSSTQSTVTASTAADRAGKSSVSIAKSMDTFLGILTTQLKHQSPLSPMDSNQFTQQLVQFASVEQQINMNQTLASVLSALQSQQSNAALGFLGNTVNFDAAQSASADGGKSIKWSFTPTDTDTYTLRVKDAGGNIVNEQTANFKANEASSFNWTSGRSDNKPLGVENYTLELYRGTGTSAVKVPVNGSGKVTAVDMADGKTYVQVNGQKIEASKITRVALPQ